MNSSQILHTDLLDLLFNKRNKTYGAYILRKYYPSRLKRALLITFSTMLILSLASLYHKPVIIFTKVYEDPAFAAIPETPKEKPITTTALNVKPVSVKHAINTGGPVLKPVISAQSNTIQKNINLASTGDQLISGPEIDLTNPTGNIDPQLKASISAITPAVPKSDAPPLNFAEVMPSFPGGIEALNKFLQKNLHSPGGLEAGDTTKVKIKFIVGYNGRLKGFEVVDDGGAAFNSEVIRVLKKMPDWIPGKSHDENVSVFYTIPVIFMPAE